MYNPGVSYTGGHSIGQGIANAGQNFLSIFTGMQQKKEREMDKAEQVAKEAKQEKRLFDSYVTQGEALGLNKDKLMTMSIGEVQGTVDGLKLQKLNEEQDQRMAERKQMMEMREMEKVLQMEEQRSARQGNQQWGDFMGGLQQRQRTPTPMALGDFGLGVEGVGSAMGSMDPANIVASLGGFGQAAMGVRDSMRLTPDVIQSLAVASGVVGTPRYNDLVSGIMKMNEIGPKGMPVGKQVRAENGMLITGVGENYAPHVSAAPVTQNTTPPAGMIPTKATMDEKGNVSTTYEPKVPVGKTEGDKAFEANADELLAKLDEFDKIVDSKGNFEFADTDAAAKLKALAYTSAINYAKIVDPASVAREGEVNAAQKYMLPAGFFTRNGLTKSAIKNMREEVGRRKEAYNKQRGNTDKPAGKTSEPAGYIAGRLYGGRKFKGGDPRDPKNWE